MNILLTGGTGFLGAWVTRRLLETGCSVRILDRSTDRTILADIAGPASASVDCVGGDVSDRADVLRASSGCDAIIHLAALLTPACEADPIRGATVNVIGTLAVFEAARCHGIRRVAYASSAAVFGPEGGDVPCPVTHYGAFKLACEGSARAYWRDCRIASVGFRPLVVFGGGRKVGSTAGITLACRHAVAGQQYVIPFTGKTDAIFVDDVAAALVAAVTRPMEGAHVFNLKGDVVSVEQVIDTIRELCPGAVLSASGPPVPIAPELAAHEPEPVLGPLPTTTFREGIARTVEFYRERAARAEAA